LYNGKSKHFFQQKIKANTLEEGKEIQGRRWFVMSIYIGQGKNRVSQVFTSTRVCTGEKYAYHYTCSLELSKDNF